MEKTTPSEWRFSVFNDPNLGHKCVTPRASISLRQLFDAYQGDILKEQSKKLLEAQSKDERDALKMRLPFITPSGTFFYRNTNSIVTYNSTLLPLDIDNLIEGDAERLRDYLSESDGCVMSVVSPRKKGVKALFYLSQRIPLLERYNTLKTNKNAICGHLGIDLIASHVDLAQWSTPQPFFLAADSNGFFNLNPQPLSIELEPYIEPQVRPSFVSTTNIIDKRIDSYLVNAVDNIIEFFASCGEGERHRNIVKVTTIASWTHYAPHLKNDFEMTLLQGVVSMYGSVENAKQNNAINSFNQCWMKGIDNQTLNPTIDAIINELLNA